jgi:hypothetical protein
MTTRNAIFLSPELSIGINGYHNNVCQSNFASVPLRPLNLIYCVNVHHLDEDVAKDTYFANVVWLLLMGMFLSCFNYNVITFSYGAVTLHLSKLNA